MQVPSRVFPPHGRRFQISRRKQKKQLPPISKFLAVRKLLENLLFVSEFVFKNAEIEAKNLHLEKVVGKIEILSTHNLLCRKFVTAC